MLVAIKEWLVSVLIAAFIINVVDLILPSGKIKPYINLVMNFIFVFIIVTPIINMFQGELTLEDRILKSYNESNQNYEQSMNDLSSKTGAQSLASNYEDYVKESINMKLAENGYELEDIEFNGSTIENIKIKEKNKNNSDNLDKEVIEFNKDDSKQVFKDKQSINTKDLKEDLNNVLDISIKKIEIN